MVPSDTAIVVERFRDEIGDWRLCILSPFGGRVHAAWGLALSARIRDELGLESDAIWSDDGIIVHLPDAEEPPGADLALLDPEEIEDAVVAELGASALFGARFRENAGRALLIPRARPGKRTPLWQQRLKSQTLLEVAKQYGEFPIILETYRECLRDVLDLPGLTELLRALHRREISLIEVETPSASPFASSLLFDYVATYMYEGDTPNAERRAAALSLDRDLLRELLGQEELRDLIDPGALETVEDDLQFRSEHRRATGRDTLHDILRTLGDLTVAELADRVLPGLDAPAMVAELIAERRAIRIRLAGEERVIDAADAGLYRDGFGVVPPGGLPAAFLEDVPDALVRIARRYGATHGPFTSAEIRARFGVDLIGAAQRCSSATASSCAVSCDRGAPSASGAIRRSCAVCAGHRWRCSARRSSRRTSGRSRAFCPPGRGSIAIPPRARGSTGCARCSSRCRGSRCRPTPGSATCCHGGPARTHRRGWTSCARRASSYGSAPARWAEIRAEWRCTSGRTCRCSAPRPHAGPRRRRSHPPTTRCASGCAPAHASSPICWSTWRSRPRSSRRCCGIWSGPVRPPTTHSRRCGRRG